MVSRVWIPLKPAVPPFVTEPRTEIIPTFPASEFPVPAIIAAAGDKASEHFLEFFAATIRNKNTRAAYVQAIAQFCRWCDDHGLQLATIRPLHVSAYIHSDPRTTKLYDRRKDLATLSEIERRIAFE